MKLYHGTNTDFSKIDLSLCAPYKDFGRGFYTTTLFDQAVAMAVRKSRCAFEKGRRAMDKIKFLTDLNIQEIIAFIVEDKGVEYDEALDLFYRSHTFEKLIDSSTGLYRESAAYVYEIFKTEQQYGKNSTE